EILCLLERHLFPVLIGFNRHGISLGLGSLFVAAFFKRTTLAFLHVKIIRVVLVLADAFLTLPSLADCHMTGRTYVHTGIFVEQKFVFFLPVALCNEWV